MWIYLQVFLKFQISLAVVGTSQLFARTVRLTARPPPLQIIGPSKSRLNSALEVLRENLFNWTCFFFVCVQRKLLWDRKWSCCSSSRTLCLLQCRMSLWTSTWMEWEMVRCWYRLYGSACHVYFHSYLLEYLICTFGAENFPQGVLVCVMCLHWKSKMSWLLQVTGPVVHWWGVLYLSAHHCGL